MRETAEIISLIVREGMLLDWGTHPGIVVASLQGLSYGHRQRGVVRVLHHVVVPVAIPRSQVVVIGILEVAVVPEGRQGRVSFSFVWNSGEPTRFYVAEITWLSRHQLLSKFKWSVSGFCWLDKNEENRNCHHEVQIRLIWSHLLTNIDLLSE